MASLPPDEIAYQMAHINESRAGTVIGVEVTFIVLATLAVALRLTSRHLGHARYGADDIFTVLALIFSIAVTITSCLLTRYGLGKHVLAVSMSDAVIFGKINFAWGLLYYIAIGLMKVAILMNLHRAFATHGTPGIWIFLLWCTVAWCVLYSVAGVLVILLECRPISGNWDARYNCTPSIDVDYANVFDILSDVFIMILPQPLIWRLNMSVKQRLRLSFLFLLGASILAISIARIPVLKSVQKSYDATWYSVDPTIISTLQPVLGVLLSSVILLPQFIHQLEERGISLASFHSSNGSRGSRFSQSRVGGSDVRRGTTASASELANYRSDASDVSDSRLDHTDKIKSGAYSSTARSASDSRDADLEAVPNREHV